MNKKLKAYAKVNLILKIKQQKDLSKKHEIESLFILEKRFYDIIKITKSNSQEIKYISTIFPLTIENCRIKKSLDFLKNKFNIDTNYEIVVEKLIPPSSGLGGSATDAATIMKFLIEKNKIKLNKEDLKEIAKKLGSDFPFFLSNNKFAKVSGIGDVVEPIKKLKVRYKIYNPLIQSSTEEIFKKLRQDNKYESKVNYDEIFNEILSKKYNKHKIYNDLQPYILENPQMNKKFEDYSRDYKKVVITGSGDSLILIK